MSERSSHTERPWLFLDIDGVLIPNGMCYDAEAEVPQTPRKDAADAIAFDVSQEGAKRHRPHLPNVMRVYVPERIAERIRRLAEVYDVVWNTTWTELAPAFETALGFEVAHCLHPRSRFKGPVLKGDAIVDFLSGEAVGHDYDLDEDDGIERDDNGYPVTKRNRPFAWVDDKYGETVHPVGSYAASARLAWLAIAPLEGDGPHAGLTEAHTAALIAFAENLEAS
jgi:hypothetical protein